jgi:hypothetical protein
VIIYLTDVAAGGETFFPDATTPPEAPEADAPPGLFAAAGGDEGSGGGAALRRGRPRRGLRVQPRAGRAIVFWSGLPGGGADDRSMHAAEPVRAGEKWIATRWCCEV